MAKKRESNRTSDKCESLTEVPRPPKSLKGAGRQYWVRIVPVLVEAKLLTAAHLEALELLCETWHEYRQHQDWITANPDELTFTTESGYHAEHPNIRFRNKAADTLQKLWAKFGLTPKALADLGKLEGVVISPIQAFAASKYGDEGD